MMKANLVAAAAAAAAVVAVSLAPPSVSPSVPVVACAACPPHVSGSPLGPVLAAFATNQRFKSHK